MHSHQEMDPLHTMSVNLKLLAHLNPGEKLSINNLGRIEVMPMGRTTFIWRYLKGDNRFNTLMILRNLYDTALSLKFIDEHVTEVPELVRRSLFVFDNLKITYSGDLSFCLELETLRASVASKLAVCPVSPQE